MDADRAQATLAQFVLRARRVEAHSLAADPVALAALCRVEFQVVLDNRTGKATITREFPPEEQLESVAARVRPLTLESDPVHFNKALAALGFLLREAGAIESYRRAIKDLRKWWTAATAPITAMSIRTVFDGGTSAADDRTLARAWLYGDVIHADPDHLDSTRDFGVEERYLAAVPYIAQLVSLAKVTLDLIRHTAVHGGVHLPQSLFDGDVVVHGTRQVGEGRVWTAEGGAEMPTDATTPLSPEWRPVQPGDLVPQPTTTPTNRDFTVHFVDALGLKLCLRRRVPPVRREPSFDIVRIGQRLVSGPGRVAQPPGP